MHPGQWIFSLHGVKWLVVCSFLKILGAINYTPVWSILKNVTYLFFLKKNASFLQVTRTPSLHFFKNDQQLPTIFGEAVFNFWWHRLKIHAGHDALFGQ
jgi:hypothetical protein